MTLAHTPPAQRDFAALRVIITGLRSAGWYEVNRWDGCYDTQREYANDGRVHERVLLVIDPGTGQGDGSIAVTASGEVGHTIWSVRIDGTLPPAVADILCQAVIASTTVHVAVPAAPAAELAA